MKPLASTKWKLDRALPHLTVESPLEGPQLLLLEGVQATLQVTVSLSPSKALLTESAAPGLFLSITEGVSSGLGTMFVHRASFVQDVEEGPSHPGPDLCQRKGSHGL